MLLRFTLHFFRQMQTQQNWGYFQYFDYVLSFKTYLFVKTLMSTCFTTLVMFVAICTEAKHCRIHITVFIEKS